MCFSASASFGAGAILSVIGVASIKKVQEPKQMAFAGIPLLFAVQQITEGVLWLALTKPDYASVQQAATYIFIFFAQIVWPIWVPFSILILTKKETRKPITYILVFIGAIVSLYLAYCLLSFHIEAKVIGYHISYIQNYPAMLSKYGGVLYIIATVAPPFFSSIKRMWTLGASILISYIITTIFYEDYIVSVWCFFASIISIAVYAILHQAKTSENKAERSIASVE